MGIFDNLKNASSYIVNFKVSRWMGMDQIKSSSNTILNMGQNVFTPQHADHTETFEQALERLKITPAQLEERRKEFTRLLIIYLVIAFAIFLYSIFIVYKHKNIMGFIMGFAVTIYALTHAFRYHFWIFQIKHKKLGCSLRDWFLDIH